MSTTIDMPVSVPALDDEEMERLRRYKEEYGATKGPVTDQAILDALTEGRFLAWLESKDDSAIVGYPKNGSKCPLYTYLDEMFGDRVEIYSVGGSVQWGDPKVRLTSLPPWAQRFIDQVDNRRNRVLAKSARKIMGAIRKEPQR